MGNGVPGMGSDLPAAGGAQSRILARGLTGTVMATMAAFILARMNAAQLPLPTETVGAVSSVAFILFALSAPVACGYAAFIAPRYERRSWVLLAVGSGLMFVGDSSALTPDGAAALGAIPSSPAPAVIWTTSYVAFFVAAVGFLDPPSSMGLARLRRTVDILLTVLLVAAVVFSVALFPAYGLSPQRELVWGLISFISLVLSISLVVLILVSRPRLRYWHLPLLLAFAAIGLGSLIETFFAAGGGAGLRTALGPVLDLPWLIAYGMFAFAAFVRVRQRNVAPRLQEVQLRESPAWVPLVMMAGGFVAIPAFVYLGISWRGDPLGVWVFTGLAVLLGLVGIARNMILSIENASLKEHALVDPLTGLYNHRFFQERLDTEVQRASREGTPVTLVCIDVDDFDQVNNAYGHSAGDRRLKAIANQLARSARSTDTACRIGGDEFAVIMPDTLPVEAYKVCLRIQDRAHEIDDGCPLPVGLSAGVAGLPDHATAREELMHKADGALYWAKLHGREQVVAYDPELVVALGPEQRFELLEQESYVRMVQLLASAVDARDPYTQQHSRRVATLATRFARSRGLTPERVGRLETAALLHDVGKIGVPDAVLRKNARLTDDEYTQIKEHPRLAVRILHAIPRQDILPWISAHHERWDGKGYPEGLRGEEIPLEGRILALCDAYDAMTSARPYRRAMGADEALEELSANGGSQFDPELTMHFVDHVRSLQADDEAIDGVYPQSEVLPA